jgi:hypothetical protein
MKNLFCLAAVVAAVSLRAAVPPAERLLPADTLAMLTVPDWSSGRSNFNLSSFGQFLEDPAMKPFAGNLASNFLSSRAGSIEKQLGIKLNDYSDLARGQITYAITRNGWDGSPDKEPGFVLLIDTRDKNTRARTNLADIRQKWIDKGNKLRADKIRDVELTAYIVPPDAVAEGDKPKSNKPTELLVGLSDTLLVLSDAPKDVEKVLALQAGSSVAPLAEQASYAANAPLARGAGAFLWADVKTFVSIFAKAAAAEQKPQASLFGPAPTIDKILNAIGLNDVQTIGASYRSSIEGTTIDVSINVPEAGRKGLFKILAVDPKDASPPPFVPADAVKFSRWRIDLQKAWTTIETMLTDIQPQLGGSLKLILDLAGKDKDPNFDLRKVLLANLGDDVISYEKNPRPGSDDNGPSLTLIGAKNAEQMATSLKALTSIVPPSMAKYEEREFLGRKVSSFVWPSLSGGKATPIVYAASGGYVAISSDPSLVEEYLRSNEGKGKALREVAGLGEAAQKVGGMNTGYFSYENQAESMRATFEAAKKDPAKLVAVPGAEVLSMLTAQREKSSTVTNWLDASLLPSFDRVSKYFDKAVSAINVGPGAITFKVFTPTPPALRK